MDNLRIFLLLILLQLSHQKPVEQQPTSIKHAVEAYENFFNTRLPTTLTSEMVTKIIRPRCGKLGPVKESHRNSRWLKKNLTFQLVDNIPGFTRNDSIMVVKNAIDAWSKNVNLVIEEVKNPNETADIKVSVERIDGPGFRLGYAYYPENGGIYLDKEEMWSLSPAVDNYNSLDANWVVIHELGHSLGLRHTDDEESVMYPYYNPMVISQITQENVNHLIDFYGEKQMSNNLLCSNNDSRKIDAIFVSPSNERIILKNHSFWIFSTNGLQFGPFKIQSYLNNQYQIPDSIDAALTIGKSTYFFKNDIYYRYTTTNRRLSKKSIRSFDGLNVKNMNAAFYYRKERILYFFKGSKYYMLDSKRAIGHRLEIDGDLIKKDWDGIPDDLDAADMLTDDRVIFVKKQDYYIYDMVSRKLELGPMDFIKDFLKCS